MKREILVLGPDREADYLESYAGAVRKSGGEPMRAWPEPRISGDETALRVFLEGFGGVLLPGGVDIEPWRYGENPHPAAAKTDRELDEVQIAAALVLLRIEIPTLAICRGMQIAAVAAGGTLIQDLPSLRPSAVRHEVRERKDQIAHAVALEPGSRVAGLSRAPEIDVNSRHHQAVREGEYRGKFGPFVITGRAPDGVLEAMEIPGHPFFVAVQWHPENLAVSGRAESLSLFRGFVRAARERRQ